MAFQEILWGEVKLLKLKVKMLEMLLIKRPENHDWEGHYDKVSEISRQIKELEDDPQQSLP